MRPTARVGMQVETINYHTYTKYGKVQTNQQRVGVGRFLIASTVYLMTMEPTASFWDCGEFISSAYKLEVGHPPGAPFFMLTANLFTQFASDPSKVAVMVNTMSALFSGLTILFLFWSITHLARKIIVEDDKTMSLGQMITIMGCGLVGSLAYTFSDTSGLAPWRARYMLILPCLPPLVFWFDPEMGRSRRSSGMPIVGSC